MSGHRTKLPPAADVAWGARGSETPTPRACPSQRTSRTDRTVFYVLTCPVWIVPRRRLTARLLRPDGKRLPEPPGLAL